MGSARLDAWVSMKKGSAHRSLAAVGSVVACAVIVADLVAPGSWGRAANAGASQPSAVLWAEHFSGAVDWTDPESHRPSDLGRIYSIVREGPFAFLHARHDCTGSSPPKAMHYGKVFADRAIPLERVATFRWRWRARVQPPVTNDPWLDMAAGIYVVMKTPSLFSKGRGFKFGWLAKPGAAGTTQRGLLQVQVRADPPSDRWSTETVNLCELYRRAFGPCEGEQVLYIGVTTDADGTRSVAEGDYADFELRSAP
jgi:hypothetical protein